MKGGDNAGQDHRDPHWPGADAERAGDALLERADLRQGMAVFQFHQLDAARQHFALFGSCHACRQTLEQRHADGLFKLANAARERRLTDMQSLGRSGDIPLFDYAQEMTKQPRMA